MRTLTNDPAVPDPFDGIDTFNDVDYELETQERFSISPFVDVSRIHVARASIAFLLLLNYVQKQCSQRGNELC